MEKTSVGEEGLSGIGFNVDGNFLPLKKKLKYRGALIIGRSPKLLGNALFGM